MLDSLSPRRRAFVTGVAVLAVAAAVAVAVAARPPARPKGVPVFVVPGYGGDERSVDPITNALRAAGRDVRVVVLPDLGRAGIAESAEALDRAVRGSRARRVDVVGFSAGGLVARAWVASLADTAVVRHVVTAGSPHHGTALVSELTGATVEDCTGSCADMRPGSGLLTRLNAGDETPAGPDWVAFWTSDDETVTPPASARLDGARNVRVQDVCGRVRVSHTGLGTDPRVVRMIVAAASAGSAAALAC